MPHTPYVAARNREGRTVREWFARARAGEAHRPGSSGRVILLLIAAVGVLVLLVGPLPWLVAGQGVRSLPDAEKADAVNAVRQVLVQAAGGALAAFALLYTARTFALSREGQVTDRYTAAVDQIAGASIDQRIGGIYALERIMRDSPKDHGAVVDVLAAFVRVHNRSTRESDIADPDGRPAGVGASDDVYAALLVLGRRPVRPDREIGPIRLGRLDLHGTVLRDARFDCVRLRNADLGLVHWERTSLRGAKLRKATLSGADLEGADLRHATLPGAVLVKTRLSGAKLDGTSFVGADLRSADLAGASMKDAHLAAVRNCPELTDDQRRQVHCGPGQTQCDEAGVLSAADPCFGYG